MAAGKEIRAKIKSVENTRKITKAMEMVAASKMRKAQERMRMARPYNEKIRDIAANLTHANPEYRHAFLSKPQDDGQAGFIVVTTDKGLCGGLNANLLRALSVKLREAKATQTVAIGGKGLGFLRRSGSNIVAEAVQLGDAPHLEKLIGPAKVLLDAYEQGKLSRVYLCYSRFINTMRQEPVIEQMLPLPASTLTPIAQRGHQWDYLYEPGSRPVLDALLLRYVETLIYQAALENLASEQSARMVAMKSATDNASNLIGELKLDYNKMRQAAITKELSEIVSGAAAV